VAELIVQDSIEIAAAPSRVWEVLTESEYTRQYMFGCDAISDWRKGSELLWKGSADGKVYVKGTIVDIEPGRLLRYTTYSPNAFDNYEDKPENYTTVTLEMTASAASTDLSVSQGDFARIAGGELRYAHTASTWPGTLAKIKEIAESR
jgi:uncharacterized protein YndB with AHSA1/START domain